MERKVHTFNKKRIIRYDIARQAAWLYLIEGGMLMASTVYRKTISPKEMGEMLGLKKTGTYWLLKKGYFETVTINGSMRVVVDSFEKWLGSQNHYKKVVTQEEQESHYLDEMIEKINRERMQENSAVKKSYTVEEVQKIIGKSRTAVYNLLKKNLFPVEYIDRYIRIPKQPFDEWLKQQ